MTKTQKGYVCIKGGFVKTIKSYPNLYSKSFSQKFPIDEYECITPKTLQGSRIFYKIFEMEHITDSSKIEKFNNLR